MYNEQELIIETDSKSIYGVLIEPEVFEDWLVVFCHGFGGNLSDHIEQAEYLANEGYASYIFDFCTGDLMSESSGHFTDYSALSEVEDLEDVLNFFEKYTEYKHFVLVGFSMGGLVAALLGAYYPYVDGLALVYPAFNIPDDARRRFVEWGDFPPEFEIFGIPAGPRHQTDVLEMDIWQEIPGNPHPTLLFHGYDDPIVPYLYSEKANEVYPNSELILYEGEGHGFSPEADHDMLDTILSFIDRIRYQQKALKHEDKNGLDDVVISNHPDE